MPDTTKLTIDQMQAKLRQAHMDANHANQQIRELTQAIAEAKAQFKPGELVTYDGARAVWYVDRVRGAVYGFMNPDEVECRYTGRALKKDGTPGARGGDIYAYSAKTPLRLARPDEIPGYKA